ncbi:MAG: hypothetical protein JWP61_2880 [Friedmanniella sp.]|nr:hypothetical protein [Friedmanniella sp.]
MLAHWDEFSAGEQRRIVSTIQYVVETDDAVNDLKAPAGLRDDLAELHKLQEYLGYV